MCTELLRYLLPEISIREIDYLDVDEETGRTIVKAKHETQKAMRGPVRRRGIRLDVYLDDGETVYNVEMQTTRDPFIGQRARLYQAHIDTWPAGAGAVLR